jgi:hypothetical protein
VTTDACGDSGAKYVVDGRCEKQQIYKSIDIKGPLYGVSFGNHLFILCVW